MWMPAADCPATPGITTLPLPVFALPRQMAPSTSEPTYSVLPKDVMPSGWKPAGRSMRDGSGVTLSCLPSWRSALAFAAATFAAFAAFAASFQAASRAVAWVPPCGVWSTCRWPLFVS